MSLCVISVSVSLGTIFLFAHTPVNDFAAFIWVNLAVWTLGICIWLTLGLAVVTAVRPRIAAISPQIAAIRSESTVKSIRVSARAKRIGAIVALVVAFVAQDACPHIPLWRPISSWTGPEWPGLNT